MNKRTFCWGGDGVGGRKEASAELLSALDSSVVTSGGASERVFFFFFLYCNTQNVTLTILIFFKCVVKLSIFTFWENCRTFFIF